MIDHRIERTARNLRKDVLRLLKAPKVLEFRNHQRGRRALVQTAEERRNLTVSSVRGLCSDLLRLPVRPTEKNRLWSAMQRAAMPEAYRGRREGGSDSGNGQNLKEPSTSDSIRFVAESREGGRGFCVVFPLGFCMNVAPPLDANQPSQDRENRLQICKVSSTFTTG